ncbi:MAG TPA: DNA topoisomerase, partial [Sphingomicrobium sp.]|nr:DNA topoisomerase [Sphingomicrobium sp.]
KDGQGFTARLVQLDGTKIERLTIGSRGEADAAKAAVEAGRFTVSSAETRPFAKNPPPPFTTSTLQQEAARKLGFSASHTMRVAQSIYEDGLITYMRTDGIDMAPEAVSAARRAIASRYDSGFVPDRPRQYQSKIKNAQEAHEAIRPTDFDRASGGSGDHARLYELIYNRALASQMASARLERTTVELGDGAGRAVLRASGQVVLFPGFMALYDEGRDDPQDEEGARMPALREGDAPAKTGVEATQSFTQPSPRYSEASLVKRLEELGIGRPSTYASILQTLKDREYVRVEKARFVPEESGRLVTAFLERFFERYVSYDYTAELEEELDDVSGGRLDWRKLLDDFWRDFRPKAGEVMDQQPSEITQAIDEFLEPWLYPPREDGSDPRVCPHCGTGRLSLRGGRFGAFVACSNYPECRYTQKFGQGGDQAQGDGPTELGDGIMLKSGRFGPYLERGDKRASIPKDVPLEDVTAELAERLLSLPREIGPHPETGNMITASIGRYGPYLAHDGKYAKLNSTAEVFETGMNAAVAKLADAASGGGRQRGASREPIAVLGQHPESGKDVKVMAGRYGPYVSDGATHATLPKGTQPNSVTLEQAVEWIDTKAAKGPSPKRGRRKAK